MHDDEEDDNILHYTTPKWCHLLIFGFAVSIAVGICQLCCKVPPVHYTGK